MTLAKASGDSSFRKASTSSGVGGRPVRSKLARRMSVRLSAGAARLSPLSANFAMMNASIGLRERTAGTAGFVIGLKAQCLLPSSMSITRAEC